MKRHSVKKIALGAFALVLAVFAMTAMLSISGFAADTPYADELCPATGALCTDHEAAVAVNGTLEHYATLAEAIAAAPADGTEVTIRLLKDVALANDTKVTNPAITLLAGQNIVLDGDNANGTAVISRGKLVDAWQTGSLFSLPETASLTLKNLTVDGGNAWTVDEALYNEALEAGTSYSTNVFLIPEEGSPVATAAIITAAGGDAVLENVTVQNLYSAGASGRGFFKATLGATLVLKNTSISHCASFSGGGVITYTYDEGTAVVLESGTVIEDIFTAGNGGLFEIRTGSSVTMNDGAEIKNVKSLNTNGTVAMMWSSNASVETSFTMNGGLVTGASGVGGSQNGRVGVFYVHNRGTFEMNGGAILENTTRSAGAVDYSRESGILVLNAGVIAGTTNTYSDYEDRDVSTSNENPITIGAGMSVGTVKAYGPIEVLGEVNGNLCVYGALTGNGIVKGDVEIYLTEETTAVSKIENELTVEGDVIVYVPAGSPITEADITLGEDSEGHIVVCEEGEVVLKLFYNGGTNAEGESSAMIAVPAGAVSGLEAPKCIGYTFLGWYLDPECTVLWDGNANERTDLYASYSKGVGIVSVRPTEETDTEKIYTITYTDGSTDTITVKNGEKGEPGKDAIAPQVRINETTGEWEISTDGGKTWKTTGVVAAGKDGEDGEDGKDGTAGTAGKDGVDGKDGADGVDGKDGKDGKDGTNGKDGDTPTIGENGNWWIGGQDTGVQAGGGGSGLAIVALIIALLAVAGDVALAILFFKKKG